MTAPRNETARQILVVGNSRSGTTMMGRILGRNPEVFTFSELHFFEQAWQPVVPASAVDGRTATGYLARLIAVQREGYHARTDPSRYGDEAAAIAEGMEAPPTAPECYAAFLAYEAARNGRTIGCDQTPRNLYYLAELLQLLPQARAVVMVRDPRDVLLSQRNRWRRRGLGATRTPRRNALRTWAGYHPLTIGLIWRGGVRAGDRLSGHPRVVQVRFEDLLANPEATVRGLCDFLGLSYVPAMLEVPRVGSSHAHDRPDVVGIDARAAGQWRSRLSRTEVWTCQRVARHEMRLHGYEPVRASPNPAALVAGAGSLIGKSALALMLNRGRTRDFAEAVRRRMGVR